MNTKISLKELEKLKTQFDILLGIRLTWFSIPKQALEYFEPSQIAVIINTLLDAALPQIELLSTDENNKKKLNELVF